MTFISHNAPLSDPADPSSVFVTPRSIPDVKEGLDFLFRCLLTDPSVTNLTLQAEGSAGGRGRGLPQGMTVTFDPKRGALIRDLQRSFNGRYVCSGWRDGRQFRSRPVDLLVAPSKTCLSVYQSVCLSVLDSISTCLLSDLSLYLSTCLSAGLRLPPSVSVSQDESVRLEGEKFEVTCLSSNPSHLYNLTWTQPNTKVRGHL